MSTNRQILTNTSGDPTTQIEINTSSIKPTICILFDIDDTLIDFDKSCETTTPAWTGGSPYAWLTQIEMLKKSAQEMDIDIHFGIATFKSIKDNIATAVIDDVFKDLLHENLIFFTESYSKVRYALNFAYTMMGLSRPISKEDVWIIDDQLRVIQETNSHGYRAIHADTLIKKTHEEQEKIISGLFQPLHNYIKKRHDNKTVCNPPTPEELGNTLIDLIKYNQHEIAKLLLTKRSEIAKITILTTSGNTPLHLALLQHKPNHKLATLLAVLNVNQLTHENMRNETPLDIAVKRQDYEIVDYFLEHHAHRFTDHKLGNVLFNLVRCKQYALAKKLFAKRPSVFQNIAEKKNGYCTLQIAIMADEPDMELVILLSQNTQTLNYLNKNNQSALDIAINKRYNHIVRHLLGQQTDIKNKINSLQRILSENHPDAEIITLLVDDIASLDYKHSNPLCFFIHNEKYLIADYYLENHYANNLTSDELGTALIQLVQKREYDLAKKLLIHYPQAKKSICNNKTNNPAINYVILEDNPDYELVTLLAENNPFLKYENNRETALDIAVRKRHYHIAEHFLKYHADKFSSDQMGRTLLYLTGNHNRYNLAAQNIASLILAKRPDATRFSINDIRLLSQDHETKTISLLSEQANNIAQFLTPKHKAMFFASHSMIRDKTKNIPQEKERQHTLSG